MPRENEPPTPEEIRQRTAEIRSGWTDAEELSHRVVKPRGWLPPGVSDRARQPAVVGDGSVAGSD